MLSRVILSISFYFSLMSSSYADVRFRSHYVRHSHYELSDVIGGIVLLLLIYAFVTILKILKIKSFKDDELKFTPHPAIQQLLLPDDQVLMIGKNKVVMYIGDENKNSLTHKAYRIDITVTTRHIILCLYDCYKPERTLLEFDHLVSPFLISLRLEDISKFSLGRHSWLMVNRMLLLENDSRREVEFTQARRLQFRFDSSLDATLFRLALQEKSARSSYFSDGCNG